MAERYAKHLETHEEQSLADICHTAGVGRSHFEERLAVVGKTKEEVAQKLLAFAEGRVEGQVARGQVKASGAPKVALLFTGQGSQYAGMGKQLYETQPVFRQALEKCAELLKTKLEKPLLEVLFPKEGEKTPLDETAYTQPALFAVEWGLWELWRSWGVKPDAVMGHSVGEYVAATVAGVMTLEEGLGLIAERGRLMQQLPQDGEMYSARASLGGSRQGSGALCEGRFHRWGEWAWASGGVGPSGAGARGLRTAGEGRGGDEEAGGFARIPFAADGADAQGLREGGGEGKACCPEDWPSSPM